MARATIRPGTDDSPLRRSLNGVVFAAGTVSALLGLTAILNEYTRFSTLVFMPLATSLGFSVCGVGLAALAFGQRRFSAVFGMTAGLVGALMLAQNMGLANLALDQQYLEISTGWVGPGTSFCFLLSGVVLLIGGLVPRWWRPVLFIASGAVVLEFGLIAFSGFEFGLATVYGSGRFAGMAISTIGFAVVGTGFLAYAWRLGVTDEHRVPAWLYPLAAGLGSLTLMGLLCQAVVADELGLKALGMHRVTYLMAGEIRKDLHFYVRALERMAKRVQEQAGSPTQRYMEEDAKRYLTDFPGLMGVGWMDEKQHIEWVFPLGDGQLMGLDLADVLSKRPGLGDERRDERPGQPWMSAVLNLTTQQGKGLLVVVPFAGSSGLGGGLAALLGIRELFASYANQLEALGLAMQLADEQGPFYSRTPSVTGEALHLKEEVSFDVLNGDWRLEVGLSRPDHFGTSVYSLIGVGAVLSFFLSAMVYFWQTSSAQARNIQDINEELHHEISERELAQRGLRTLNDTLERRIQERTRELEGSRRAAINMMQDAHEAQQRAEQAEERLHEYAEELQRSNTDLERFAFIASHDLKSPLRAIHSLSTWIAEDLEDKLTAESRRHIELLHGRVRRMEAMVDALLQYSRAGRMQYDEQEVAVADLIEEIKDFLDLPPRFQVTAGPDLPVLWTQKAPLQQVLVNLIGNAVKHHDRPDGRVVVRCRQKGAFFEFCVSDDGPGIPAEYHEKVFELFQTLQPRDRVESTGIGLALVKRIIERMGGSIELISDGKRGSDFRFEWPGKRIERSEM